MCWQGTESQWKKSCPISPGGFLSPLVNDACGAMPRTAGSCGRGNQSIPMDFSGQSATSCHNYGSLELGGWCPDIRTFVPWPEREKGKGQLSCNGRLIYLHACLYSLFTFEAISCDCFSAWLSVFVQNKWHTSRMLLLVHNALPKQISKLQ